MREQIPNRSGLKPTSNLTWACYQQMPLVPRGGYVGPKTIAIKDGPPKINYDSKPGIQLDTMRREDRDKSRIEAIFRNASEVTLDDVERELQLSKGGAKAVMKGLAERNLVMRTGRKLPNGCVLWMRYREGYVPPPPEKKHVMTKAEYLEQIKEQGKAKLVADVTRIFVKEKLSTNEIAVALGLNRTAALQRVKHWRADNLVEECGYDGPVKLWRRK